MWLCWSFDLTFLRFFYQLNLLKCSFITGVRPHPVNKLTPEKAKRIETEAPQEKKVTPAKHDQSVPTGSLDGKTFDFVLG